MLSTSANMVSIKLHDPPRQNHSQVDQQRLVTHTFTDQSVAKSLGSFIFGKKVISSKLRTNIGLPDHSTEFEEDLINYFAKFVAIKDGGSPRGSGFITFESDQAVEDVLQTTFHEVRNTKVEVRRARPQVRNGNQWENWYDCDRVGLEFGVWFQIDDLAFGFDLLICCDCGGAYGYVHYEGCMYATDPYKGVWKNIRFVPSSCYVFNPRAWDGYCQPNEDLVTSGLM
ncbi:hypothetical protein ACLB2K_008029 [Fragaria x ananassa]